MSIDVGARAAIRAAISNAYYETRNAGGTMEDAADAAADAVARLVPAEDEGRPDLASEYGRLLAWRDRLVSEGADPADLEMPERPLSVAPRPAEDEGRLREAAALALSCLDVMVERQTLTGAQRARNALRAALAATPEPQYHTDTGHRISTPPSECPRCIRDHALAATPEPRCPSCGARPGTLHVEGCKRSIPPSIPTAQPQ